MRASEFQSSPAPRRGRYQIADVEDKIANLFQSSPAPRRGRYRYMSTSLLFAAHVSILARASARALPGSNSDASSLVMFQSSPAPRRGRYTENSARLACGEFVSILARASARALRTNDIYFATCDVFQSSPAPRRGRYGAAGLQPTQPTCFNPRPRLGAGATHVVAVHVGLLDVSILARASARALHTPSVPFFTIDSFQSSPAPRRGRYSLAPLAWAGDIIVSILARASARALPVSVAQVAAAGLVSILARASARALLRRRRR